MGKAHGRVFGRVDKSVCMPCFATAWTHGRREDRDATDVIAGMSISTSWYRRCLLEVQGYMFPANLMELPFEEFDLILGMDWLVEHQVGLDFESKCVTFRVGGASYWRASRLFI
ncbi:Cadherin-related family member 4 [Gossypium australe]|uniref:Cadherin-related family member 4 n=1 Tax=Gossypium australe TaxID=47621 RepID=A0A5B6VYN3_9ROSI|nr:Cadherin-related family member 4 [Gossypium australe]